MAAPRDHHPASLMVPPFVVAALFMALLLRGALVVLNEEANDDHVRVIQAIAYEGRIPAPGEFWESFQPKLYHVAVAGVLQGLPRLSRGGQYRVAQAVSCAAGLLTLVIVFLSLRDLGVPPVARWVTLSLVALAPDMIGVSGQATNDAFVILFSAAASYLGWRFLQVPGGRLFAAVTAAAILAGLSKGNGLVVSVAILALLTVALAHPPADGRLPRRRSLVFLTAFLLAFGATVPLLGSYVANYRRAGTPFAINVPQPERPPWFVPSDVTPPGVTDVVSGFLTFRLIGMLQEPLITLGANGHPRHLTSLWSQLYGRMHFAHFAAWPPSWASRRPYVHWLGRTVLLVALVPTAILAIGLARATAGSVKCLRHGETSRFTLPDLLLTLVALGYLGFVVLYTYQFRSFTVMKSIFVAPRVVAFAALFARQLARQAGAFQVVALALAASLGALYVLDFALIVTRLALRFFA